LNRFDTAFRSYRSLVPKQCKGVRLLARYYEQGMGCNKNPKRALKLLRELELTCDCAETLCELAKLHHVGLVTTKEALKLLERAVESNPRHAESWYEKGILHLCGKGITPQ
jgi:TPR repeat protein